MSVETPTMPRAFIWRKIHSLFGLWIVIFLIEHLLTNSQAALLIGDNGNGFVRAVNFIKNLPYLPVIEIVLLGVPILVHAAWGIKYLITGKMNSFPGTQNRPVLTRYGRNHAYSWQRITSYILLLGIILHVGYMRFYKYPIVLNQGDSSAFFVRISMDKGLYTVANRLGVKLYNENAIENEKESIDKQIAENKALEEKARMIEERAPVEDSYSSSMASILDQNQHLMQEKAWLHALEKRKIDQSQVIAVADNFGTATLLVVRDSFKSIFVGVLYTIFVVAAVFHGFNGLWTFMITWGWVLSMRSQSKMVNFCVGVMLVVGFLGLASIWGTYWINLKH